MRPLLVIILLFAIGGLAFSGYLTYEEMFAATSGGECTPLGEPGTMLGAPPCVYGFFMYLVIVALTVMALVRSRRASPR